MAIILAQDSFKAANYTNLSSHTPEVGVAWTKRTSGASFTCYIHSRAVTIVPEISGFSSTIYTIGMAPALNYYVQARFFTFLPEHNYRPSIFGRMQSSWSEYVEIYPVAIDSWILRDVGTGSTTISGTCVQGMMVKLVFDGVNVSVYFDDVYAGGMTTALGAGIAGFAIKKLALT